MSIKYKSLQVELMFKAFIHKHKIQIGRAIRTENEMKYFPGKEDAKAFLVIKKQIIQAARNEMFQTTKHLKDQRLWDKIRWNYIRL